MIIALSGRKQVGKTTLSNILANSGFKVASFATPLKEYVSQLYSWNITDLCTQEGKESILTEPVLWDNSKCQELARLIGVAEVPLIREEVFSTRRDALQFIGTDVLRSYDPDFHVNEFKKKFTNGNYFCDDVRFPNELQALKELDAICIYVIRPYNWVYSNHPSETSLHYSNFDYICLNDGSLRKLIRKFSMFLEHCILEDKSKTPFSREEFILKLKEMNYDSLKLADSLKCSRDKIIWWAVKYMVDLPRSKYSLDHLAFSKINSKSAYWAGVLSADGTIKKHLKHDFLLELSNTDESLVAGFKEFLKSDKSIYHRKRLYGKDLHTLCVSSQFLIDDLKLWNVEPRKSRLNKIPDCIRNNEELLPYWIVGLVDGDGSIYISNYNKNIHIQILASKEIVEYLAKWVGIKCGCYPEKNIENLFTLNYCGKQAVALYKKIYKGMGLSRKWSQVEPFLNKKWHH